MSTIQKTLVVLILSMIFSGCCSVFNINCPSTSEDINGNEYFYLNFDISGFDRNAKIYVPSTNIDTVLPVLFYFHGYSGDAEDSDTRRQFQTLWPEAIIVYADGRVPYDGNSSEAGWRIRFPYINQVCGEEEDLQYIDEIMQELRLRYLIDNNRIFASGHSSGAFFTLSLMELKPDLFKGFALLGAYSRYSVNTSNVNCNDTMWTRPTPLQLPPNAIASTPRPVLYLFGSNEIFDNDGPDLMQSNSTNCNEESRFRKTVDELLIRNRCAIPTCNSSPNDYITRFGLQVYNPVNALGAQTQIWRYNGTHSWESHPDDADQLVVDYFKGL